MFAHYLIASSVSGQNIQINTGTTNNVALSTDLAGSNDPGFSCASGSNAIKTMVDESYAHTSSSLTLKISTTGGMWWGIK